MMLLGESQGVFGRSRLPILERPSMVEPIAARGDRFARIDLNNEKNLT